MKHFLPIIVLMTLSACVATSAAEGGFTRLARVEQTRVIAAAEPFPGGQYDAENILNDPAAGGSRREYASHGQGAKTFVDFDFGGPVRVGAMRHVQRSTKDTIAAADLIFSDSADFKQPAGVVHVTHDDNPGATTFVTFAPITARYVRWHATRVNPRNPQNVGGCAMAFFQAGETESTPSGIGIDASVPWIVERRGEQRFQPLKLTLDYPYAQPLDVTLRVPGQAPRSLKLTFGKQTVDYVIPAVETPQKQTMAVELGGRTLVSRDVQLKPARHQIIYILPHSHTDIGYTEIQSEIEDKQVNNLLQGIEYARKTASYPPGARFVWNVEVMWAADLYLRRLGPSQRQALVEAIKNGQVALNGMYLNELTGLCRPEELMRLFRFATQMRQQTGATIDSAMISDVPGYTWGTVTAMAQAGIRYFSVAPNYFDRIGDILVQWENKPFWWVGPSEKDKVLVWIPYKGYAMSHVYRQLTPAFVDHYLAKLAQTGYPYEIAYMRWAGHGDNAVPDPAICDFVKEWSANHDWPRFIISSTGEAFGAFEKRYGDQIPKVRGDWSPYWEDGAGSSSLETGMNRASADRLIQAEALWAMSAGLVYPAAEFESAWRHVLLYSEHTWGAWCSISDPARRETLEQWTVKQSYAVAADRESRDLLSRVLAGGQQSADQDAIDVFNTVSWARSDLVIVPKYLSERRDRVLDDQSRPVPSQRLKSGELAFVATDMPALSARRYKLESAPALPKGDALARGNEIRNALLSAIVDPKSGAIVELRAKDGKTNLVDASAGHAVNDYLYLVGDNLADLKTSGPARISVLEGGPVVASLRIECDAPGCNSLRRELRVVSGLDRLELVNTVDKQRLRAPNYHDRLGKESVNFAFPFNVPGGQVRLDVPFGVVRPDADQIPSACKNWLTAARWADVSNDGLGVTWITLDAPLVQIGGITATLLGSQTNPAVWRKHIEPTQKFYCWAMNNHWGTNYRAYQEGPVPFRFALRPHGKLDLADASRLAIGLSQPLLATGVRAAAGASMPLLRIDSPDVLVTGMKPSDDGQALIVRLWGGAGRDASANLTWSDGAARRVWLSDLSEQPLTPAQGAIAVPAWGVVTLRVQRE